MTDTTDKRIEELWQYIPPYTAPNYPPQVKVITTTNTGDTPMTEEDPDLLAGDNLDRLRGNYAQKTNEILQATRGLSSTNTEGTHLIECLRSHLKVVTEEMERYYNALTPAQRENLPKPEGVGK